MSDIDVNHIQKLQFSDRAAAEQLVARWFHEMVGLDVDEIELRPSAVSLNSFKGFGVLDGRRVFFKSHTERDSNVTSFYDSASMERAGYDIARPLASRSALGTQVVIYDSEHIDMTSVFDLVRSVETRESPSEVAERVLRAERTECDRLLDIYDRTGEMSSGDVHAGAAVHQLFHHRLAGKRFEDFYGEGRSFGLPDGSIIATRVLFALPWRINGVVHDRSLRDLVREGLEVLRPDRPAYTAIGHGDAHAGNIFLTPETTYRYFAPAFGGRHSVLLDITKPLFHNVFARWMYFPDEVARELSDATWQITRDYVEVTLPLAESPYRRRLHETKVAHLVDPALAQLAEAGALPDGARPLDLALMCCPLLTVDLTNRTKYPAIVGLLGLAQAVAMGSGEWRSGPA